jgi:Negative regulator of beta-lactamase expression
MKIKNHRLFHDDDTEYPFVSNNPNQGGVIQPLYLIIHYTAGADAQSSIAWLTNPVSQASAHLVIARDGSITQLVPFNKRAWHAGKSKWAGLSGLNGHSIGIELDNAGRLVRKNGRWHSPISKIEYPDSEVIEAVHKHETTPAGWLDYTARQIEAAIEVGGLLVSKYELKDVLGHDDISPMRKVDPGPAFPMESYRSKVMGRKTDEDDELETTTNLNIRSGPGVEFPRVLDKPLPPATRVMASDVDGSWMFVDVVGEVHGVSGVQGWVHGKFLKEVS